MNVTESFEVPFESPLDWRNALFNIINEACQAASKEILLSYKESEVDINWNDTQALVKFAIDNGLIEKLSDSVAKQLRQLSAS